MVQAEYEGNGEGRDRASGCEPPRRSRSGPSPKKPGKARASRSSRKAKVPNGIHQRRNKRMAW